MLDAYSKKPFDIKKPVIRRIPFVFNSPHSGRLYTQEFLNQTKLNHLAIRKSEDFMVDELFACAIGLGAPMISANFPRALLDVNREPYELDPAMFSGELPAFVNTKSIRVVGGLGTIARIVAENEEIYYDKIPVEDGLARIEKLYKPYHTALRDLLAQSVNRFGYAVLIDCHSMPSVSERQGRLVKRSPFTTKADFVIGNRYDASCTSILSEVAYEHLINLGYNVSMNKPYAGGFITEHYGRPQYGLHALQIEVNRALYMNELRMRKSDGFDALTLDIASLCEKLVDIPEHYLTDYSSLAAE